MEASQDAIANLGRAISDKEFRDSFPQDPDGALQRAGIDKGELPPKLLETLTTMSSDELAALATVKDALAEHDVPPHIKAEWV
jgi:hypothetical protein